MARKSVLVKMVKGELAQQPACGENSHGGKDAREREGAQTPMRSCYSAECGQQKSWAICEGSKKSQDCWHRKWLIHFRLEPRAGKFDSRHALRIRNNSAQIPFEWLDQHRGHYGCQTTILYRSSYLQVMMCTWWDFCGKWIRVPFNGPLWL